jgi:hypothetical protein
MQPHCKRWSAEDIQRLIEAVESGMSPFRAAAKLERTVKAVQIKARQVGKPFEHILEKRREQKIVRDAAAKGAHHAARPKKPILAGNPLPKTRRLRLKRTDAFSWVNPSALPPNQK